MLASKLKGGVDNTIAMCISCRAYLFCYTLLYIKRTTRVSVLILYMYCMSCQHYDGHYTSSL